MRAAQTIVTLFLMAVVILASGCSRNPREQATVEEHVDQELANQPASTPSVLQTPKPALQQGEAITGTSLQQETTHRPPLREDPNYRPPQPTMGPAFDDVAARITQALEGIGPQSPDAARKVARLWEAATVPSLEESITVGGINASSETQLPSEISEIASLSDKEIEALLVDGRLPFSKSAEEFDAAASRLMLALGSTVAGLGELPPLLRDRANSLPPTREDIVNYFAVSQALRELRSGGAGATTLQEWESISNAKNPVYRLLALMAAQKAATPDTRFESSESRDYSEIVLPERLAFYQRFLEEDDPIILAETLKAIGNVSLPQAKAVLESFREQQLATGNSEIAELSEAAIRSCEANLRWSTN